METEVKSSAFTIQLHHILIPAYNIKQVDILLYLVACWFHFLNSLNFFVAFTYFF